jgi:hypothetical protein
VAGGTLELDAFVFPANQIPRGWRAITAMDRDAQEFQDDNQSSEILCMVLGFRVLGPERPPYGEHKLDPTGVGYGTWDGLFLGLMDGGFYRRMGFFDSDHYSGYNKYPSDPGTCKDMPPSAIRRRLKIR